MIPPVHPFPYWIKSGRVMLFVDGENLTLRYQDQLGDAPPLPHVSLRRDVWVWSRMLNAHAHDKCEILRTHYYTSVVGDDLLIATVEDELKDIGIDAPRVFKRPRDRRSKQVDISLAVEMLGHAQKRNIDAAVLVAGDLDYLPLARAVMAEGCRVFLWFLDNGLNATLRRQTDHYFDVGKVLFAENASLHFDAT